MQCLRKTCLLALAMGIFVGWVFAQETPPQPARALAQSSEKTRRPYVGIIGASVSAGFVDVLGPGQNGERNRSLPLDRALRAVWPKEKVRIWNGGNLLMFLRPERLGRQQVRKLQRKKPDLVIGVDFMFWFGYGEMPYAENEKEARLALQKKGLALLEELSCPVLLGDYPDMHGAETRMLPRFMIPSEAALAALNENLRNWAKARKNVRIFPLARFVRDATKKKQVIEYGSETLTFRPAFLLQTDKLHATRLGTAVLVTRMAKHLRVLLDKEHALVQADFSLPHLVRQLELEDELPEDKEKKEAG